MNGYCDEEAGREIRERIENLSPMGVHFIDSGNFHLYKQVLDGQNPGGFCIGSVWIIIEICSRPASGELVLGGSWVRDTLDMNPLFAEGSVMIGIRIKSHSGSYSGRRLPAIACQCFTTDPGITNHMHVGRSCEASETHLPYHSRSFPRHKKMQSGIKEN